MSVKRYDITSENCFPWGEFMEEDVEGEYVLHSDYADLLARHNALKEEATVMIVELNANYADLLSRHNALLARVAMLEGAARRFDTVMKDSGDHPDTSSERDALRDAVEFTRKILKK